jgi:DNA-binding GntR family transcriptional regulator
LPQSDCRFPAIKTRHRNDIRRDRHYFVQTVLPIHRRCHVKPVRAENLRDLGRCLAVRGRGHIVRRKRPRLTVPCKLYGAIGAAAVDPALLEMQDLEVYQEVAPDNIALPLESGADLVWVRRAVYASVVDRQAIQIHVSWLAGLGDDAGSALRALDPAMSWPEAVQQVTGRTIATVLQNTRARGANPFEAATFAIPDATTVLVSHLTTYDAGHRPVEHSRFAWPTDAVRISDEYSYPAGADVEPQ